VKKIPTSFGGSPLNPAFARDSFNDEEEENFHMDLEPPTSSQAHHGQERSDGTSSSLSWDSHSLPSRLPAYDPAYRSPDGLPQMRDILASGAFSSDKPPSDILHESHAMAQQHPAYQLSPAYDAFGQSTQQQITPPPPPPQDPSHVPIAVVSEHRENLAKALSFVDSTPGLPGFFAMTESERGAIDKMISKFGQITNAANGFGAHDPRPV